MLQIYIIDFRTSKVLNLFKTISLGDLVKRSQALVQWFLEYVRSSCSDHSLSL